MLLSKMLAILAQPRRGKRNIFHEGDRQEFATRARRANHLVALIEKVIAAQRFLIHPPMHSAAAQDGPDYFRFGVFRAEVFGLDFFGMEIFGLGIVAQPYSTISQVCR